MVELSGTRWSKCLWDLSITIESTGRTPSPCWQMAAIVGSASGVKKRTKPGDKAASLKVSAGDVKLAFDDATELVAKLATHSAHGRLLTHSAHSWREACAGGLLQPGRVAVSWWWCVAAAMCSL